jgi:hypothetical protein
LPQALMLQLKQLMLFSWGFVHFVAVLLITDYVYSLIRVSGTYVGKSLNISAAVCVVCPRSRCLFMRIRKIAEINC